MSTEINTEFKDAEDASKGSAESKGLKITNHEAYVACVNELFHANELSSDGTDSRIEEFQAEFAGCHYEGQEDFI